MLAEIKSLALDYGVVLKLVEDYLNANVLRARHVVKDMDCCDKMCISVGLELAPATEAVSDEKLIAAGWDQVEIDEIVHNDNGREAPVGFFDRPVRHNGAHDPLRGPYAGGNGAKEDAAVSQTEGLKRGVFGIVG